MKFKLTKDHEGLVITTKWKKWRHHKKGSITGIVKFVSIDTTILKQWVPTFLERAQLWYNPKDWIWFRHTCDMRNFKVLSPQEAIIWRIEHNM